MIEIDTLLYLKSYPSLIALLPATSIYNIQAPSTDVKMPWLVLEKTSGLRKRITHLKTEETAYIRITVDVGPSAVVKGRNIAEQALIALENYRGNMGDSKDIIVTCGAIRGYAGYSECYRYQFDVTIKLIEDIHFPS